MKHTKEDREEFLIKRNMLSYFIISFVQGISSLADLAIQYFLKDYLMLEPYQMSRTLAFVMIPWIIKPVLGLLTDLVPIFGYRRKIYLIACGLIGFVSWLYMSFYADNLIMTIVSLTLVNFAFSFGSIIGEAIVVELSKKGETLTERESKMNSNNGSYPSDKIYTSEEKAKNYVSLFFLFKNIGALLSAFFRGYLIEIISIRRIFLLNAFVPLFILLAGLILIEHPTVVVRKTSRNEEESKKWEEERVVNKYHDYFSVTTSFDEKKEHLLQINREIINVKHQSRKISVDTEITRRKLVYDFYNFMMKKEVYIPAIFSVLLFATPNFADPFFYYMTNFLNFSPSELGILSLMTSTGVLIAIISYRFYFKICSFKYLVSASTLLYFLFTFLSLILVLRINLIYNIPDLFVCVFGFIFLSILGEMSIMPILTLACALCPKNLEATAYSLFMSSINLGLLLSGLNSSFITSSLNVSANNFDNLGLMIIMCNCFKIIPIIALFFIDKRFFEGPKEAREEEYFMLKAEHEEECLNPKENVKQLII